MTSIKQLNYLSLACFGYGSFLLISYAATVYLAVWRGEFLPVFPGPRRLGNLSPWAALTSPYAFLLLLTGLFFLLIGYALWTHVRKTETKNTKDFVISSLLTEEEKAALKSLTHNGVMTQKELSAALGFSAVKTHRVLSRLEDKKLV